MNTKPRTSIRNSSLEILRIISMVMIIAHHYVVHGNFDLGNIPFSMQKVFTIFLSCGGKLGVSLFILISGYFSIKSEFNLKRIIMLIVKVWVFSIFFLALFTFVLTPVSPITFNSLIMSILPNIFSSWGFTTDYIILSLLAPFLNKAILALTKKQHRNLIAILFVIWCLIPTFTTAAPAFSSLSWCITLYIISSYFALYPVKIKFKLHVVFCIFWAFIIFLSIFSIEYLGMEYSFFKSRSHFFSELNSLPAFMLSLELFLVFSNMKPRYLKHVNAIASTTLGVYLIHENLFMRPYIWGNIFKNAQQYNSPMFFLHYIGVVVIVFAVCSFIDWLFWKKTIGRFIGFLLNKYLKSITTFLGKIKNNITKVVLKFI